VRTFKIATHNLPVTSPSAKLTTNLQKILVEIQKESYKTHMLVVVAVIGTRAATVMML